MPDDKDVRNLQEDTNWDYLFCYRHRPHAWRQLCSPVISRSRRDLQ